MKEFSINKTKDLIQKYPELLRFSIVFALGIAAGMTFNAICEYNYSVALIRAVKDAFSAPFAEADGIYSAFFVIISKSKVDIVSAVVICFFGLTFICRQLCNVYLFARGTLLGISTGVLASSASADMITAKHPIISSVVFLLNFCIISALFIGFSFFALRASVVFRNYNTADKNLIFNSRFVAYILACIAVIGAIIVLNAIYSLFIFILTI